MLSDISQIKGSVGSLSALILKSNTLSYQDHQILNEHLKTKKMHCFSDYCSTQVFEMSFIVNFASILAKKQPPKSKFLSCQEGFEAKFLKNGVSVYW